MEEPDARGPRWVLAELTRCFQEFEVLVRRQALALAPPVLPKRVRLSVWLLFWQRFF